MSLLLMAMKQRPTLITGFTVQASEDLEDITVAIITSEFVTRSIETQHKFARDAMMFQYLGHD